MNNNTNPLANELDLRTQINKYLKYWYLFVLGGVIALVLATIYLRYTTNLYKTESTIIIKDEKGGGGAEELSAFAGLGGFLSKFQSNKIENEIAILKSKRIIKEVINTLQLNITYQTQGSIKATELYNYKPFQVQYLSFNDSLDNSIKNAPTLTIEIKDQNTFTLQPNNKTYPFGTKIDLAFGAITVIPNLDNLSRFNAFKDKPIVVAYRDADKLAFQYQKRIQVANAISSSNVVLISLEDALPEKAEDFINELVFQYNKDAIEDRGQIAKKTSDFIDERLTIITKELDSVETGKETFKSANRLVDIEAQAQLILQNASEFEKRQFNVNTQLELTNTMVDYMEKASNNDLLPANIGLEEGEVAKAVENYNQLILQRNKLLKSSTSKNPVVVNVNSQIEEIRATILSSLQNTSNALKTSLRDLNYQESVLNSKLSKVPTSEKIYRGIERQQSIKEQLYLFLLQQREEASISLAVTSSKAKVVDKAYSTNQPISPKKTIIYLGALLAGLLVPFLFVYSKIILNNKIENRKDIEIILPNVSLVGEIPKINKDHSQLVQENDRSILAESFRILRTNLQYTTLSKLKNNPEAKSIFVTSTIKGEGKTFVAFNLALTIALTGKKVVLVGGDIRNPQLHRYLPKEYHNKKGLTEFIVDQDIKVTDIVLPSVEHKNLTLILSGAIPPNPAELLMQDRTKHFFESLKKDYDFVIVDTAPSMLVTDTILINHLADITLYVIRAGYTEKRLLEFTKDAISEERLQNIAVVINNVNLNNFGYGNKYGYSYAKEKNVKWWQFTKQ